MQHGIKRVKQTAEAIEARKLREKAKIQEYLALTDDILARVCVLGIVPNYRLNILVEEGIRLVKGRL